ncbi:hypothetical protein ACW2Q0_25745 [Nocardia sp. R16R-3T]
MRRARALAVVETRRQRQVAKGEWRVELSARFGAGSAAAPGAGWTIDQLAVGLPRTGLTWA